MFKQMAEATVERANNVRNRRSNRGADKREYGREVVVRTHLTNLCAQRG